MAHIDYFFATISPFTYLAGTGLEDIAQKHGVTIAYKPMDLMTVFGRTGGVPPKDRHISRIEMRAQELPRQEQVERPVLGSDHEGYVQHDEAVEQLRNMPIRGSSGQHVKLGDMAQIRRGYVEPATVKVRHQGQQVIALGVSMNKGGDIIALGQALRAQAVHVVD